MNIVKHLKNSNSQQSPKKSFQYWIKFTPAVFLATLIGTYLDLYFVGTEMYSFPNRPFPNIFTINIAFTLVGLPLFITLFLYISMKVRYNQILTLALFLSLIFSVGEKVAENFGLFVHDRSWHHFYSFVGYFLFLLLIDGFHKFWEGTFK